MMLTSEPASAADRDNPLGNEKLNKLLASYALPSIVSMLANSIYNLVDQMFIGNVVGTLGNAATNVAYPLVTLSFCLSLLIEIGAAAVFSLELGRGRKERAEKCVGDAVILCVIFGIGYAVFMYVLRRPIALAFGATTSVLPLAETYIGISSWGQPMMIFMTVMTGLIRADERPKYSMTCILSGALANIGLDALFMYGFGWGIAGAAYATVMAQAISAFLCALYLPRFQQVRLQRNSFQFQMRRGLRMASYGASNSLNQLMMAVVQILFNNVLTYYGLRSVYGPEIPLAVMGITLKINSVIFAIYVGLSQGAQPILGFNYGARQYNRVKKTFHLESRIGLIVGIASFVVIQCFAEQILLLFGGQSHSLFMSFGTRYLRTFLFLIFLTGFYILVINYFSAVGKPGRGMLIAVVRQMAMYVPCIFILPHLFGIYGVALVGPVTDAVVVCVCFFMMRRQFRQMPGAEASNESDEKP